MEKMQESINKNLEELRNKHTETNNTITEIENTLEGISSRIFEEEECIILDFLLFAFQSPIMKCIFLGC